MRDGGDDLRNREADGPARPTLAADDFGAAAFRAFEDLRLKRGLSPPARALKIQFPISYAAGRGQLPRNVP